MKTKSDDLISNAIITKNCYICLEEILDDADADMKCLKNTCIINCHLMCARGLVKLECPYCHGEITSDLSDEEIAIIKQNEQKLHHRVVREETLTTQITRVDGVITYNYQRNNRITLTLNNN